MNSSKRHKNLVNGPLFIESINYRRRDKFEISREFDHYATVIIFENAICSLIDTSITSDYLGQPPSFSLYKRYNGTANKKQLLVRR